MSRFSTFSDDYYVNTNLNTEMDLPSNRESVLTFFEQIRKRYPEMKNFYSREANEFVLEEDKDRGQYRWVTVEPRRILSGHVNPDSVEEAISQHRCILDISPYFLSASPLDCESLNVMFGFDFTYRGNHNQLVGEALGMSPAMERIAEIPGATVLAQEPSIQLALDEDCRVQLRLSVETRTNAYHIRTGEFPDDQISVYLTARRYGTLDADETFVDVFDRLQRVCRDVIDDYVVENVLLPLQSTIAAK